MDKPLHRHPAPSKGQAPPRPAGSGIFRILHPYPCKRQARTRSRASNPALCHVATNIPGDG